MLIALQLQCHNTAYQPVMQAVALLNRYAHVDGRRATTLTRKPRLWMGSCLKAGEAPSKTNAAASNGFSTSCACWLRYCMAAGLRRS